MPGQRLQKCRENSELSFFRRRMKEKQLIKTKQQRRPQLTPPQPNPNYIWLTPLKTNMTLEICPFSIGNTSSNVGPFTKPPCFFREKSDRGDLGLGDRRSEGASRPFELLGCRVDWVEQTTETSWWLKQRIWKIWVTISQWVSSLVSQFVKKLVSQLVSCQLVN